MHENNQLLYDLEHNTDKKISLESILWNKNATAWTYNLYTASNNKDIFQD